MHIAIFTDYYLPTRGGVQTAIYQQKLALEKRGHTVTIVTVDYPEHRADASIIRLPSILNISVLGHKHLVFLPFPGADAWLMKRLQARRIDVIHIENEFTVALLGMRVAKRLHLPVVYTAHTLLWKQASLAHWLPVAAGACLIWCVLRLYARGLIPHRIRGSREPWRIRVVQELVAYFANNVTIVITPSSHLGDTLQKFGVKNPIRAQLNFTNASDRKVSLPEIPTFLWVGHLSREKRPLDFIDALAIVEHSCGPDAFRVMIAGNGEFMDEIHTRVGQKEWLVHLGPVSPEKMGEMYDRSSVLVMTSQDFDNQPMSIAEATVHGRGCVLVDPKLRDGVEHGSAVWPVDRTPRSLADSLIQLISNPSEIDLMSEQAWVGRYVFLPEHGAEVLESIYDEACEIFNES